MRWFKFASRSGTSRSSKRIHLYAQSWNEERLLPFFFRHYDPFVERYVFYDDNSSDATLRCSGSPSGGGPTVRAHRPWLLRGVGAGFAEGHVEELRGVCDWVIVTAVDEHLYHPDLTAYLARRRTRGITVIPGLGYDMGAREFPAPHMHLASTLRPRGQCKDEQIVSLRSGRHQRDQFHRRPAQGRAGRRCALPGMRRFAEPAFQVHGMGLLPQPLSASGLGSGVRSIEPITGGTTTIFPKTRCALECRQLTVLLSTSCRLDATTIPRTLANDGGAKQRFDLSLAAALGGHGGSGPPRSWAWRSWPTGSWPSIPERRLKDGVGLRSIDRRSGIAPCRTEGPVLVAILDECHDHVVGCDAAGMFEFLAEETVERLLLFLLARAACDLQDHDRVGAGVPSPCP